MNCYQVFFNNNPCLRLHINNRSVIVVYTLKYLSFRRTNCSNKSYFVHDVDDSTSIYNDEFIG